MVFFSFFSDSLIFSPCRFSKDEEDGAIERDLELENGTLTYVVQVCTGNVSGAGTDANVFIVLYGEKVSFNTFYHDVILWFREKVDNES